MQAASEVLVALVLVAAPETMVGSESNTWPAAELGCGDWTEHGSRTMDEAATRLAQSLPGYREMRRHFQIERLDIECGVPEPPALWVRLRAKSGKIPNGIEWHDPLRCCWEPTLTWNDLLSVFRSGTAVISRHLWLADWASSGRGNEVIILARATSGVSDSDDELQTFVLPAWKLAGFAGAPDYKVLLRRHGTDPAAELFFSTSDDRALVTITWPSEVPRHWLDRLDVQAHPADAPRWDYVTVTPTGEWKRPTYERVTDDNPSKAH